MTHSEVKTGMTFKVKGGDTVFNICITEPGIMATVSWTEFIFGDSQTEYDCYTIARNFTDGTWILLS